MLDLFLGVLVGISLGLTGGGGSLLAVPFLIYGLKLEAKSAVSVSLVSVGAAALIGTIRNCRQKCIDFSSGINYMVFGMLGAPLGSMLAKKVPSNILTLLFAILMLIVAFLMWRKASGTLEEREVQLGSLHHLSEHGESSAPKLWLLPLSGIFSGVFSGLFGVGGGFIIVPSLVFVLGLEIRRAIATSLLIITGISISGTASALFMGIDLPLSTTMLFMTGSVVGIWLGQRMSAMVSGSNLQKTVAIIISLLATFVLYRNLA